jgi:hypothetical protein
LEGRVSELLAENKPVLFYNWEPNGFTAQHSFTRITLPPVTSKCLSNVSTVWYGLANNGQNCDYPQVCLLIAFFFVSKLSTHSNPLLLCFSSSSKIY